jgi:DMSO/TMAO reductase YedYZ molybdopterin-dependent catalytic subunit
MLLFRLTLGALTLPEVLVDGVTTLVPLGLFSLAVGALGSWAKQLLGAALSAALLAAGGGGGLLWHWSQARWPMPSSKRKWWLGAALGLGLWLLAMALVMPASGRGFFGTALRPWPADVALAWLASSLAYALGIAALYSRPKAPIYVPEAATDATRRLLLKRLTWTMAGLVVAAGAGAAIWKLISGLADRAISPLTTGKLPPEITPNEVFYTVSKNLFDPRVEAESWSLEMSGLVERSLTVNYEQLKDLPTVTQYLTLECISNEVGSNQIGNALWKGVRLREILSQAGVKDSVRKVVLYAADDYSDSITPDKALEEGTILAYEMNGVPLPDGHGFPARLLVPGIYGMKNVKWLTRIELVDYDYRGYWQDRGWSDEAKIKTMSRIDVPSLAEMRSLRPDPDGQVMLGGVAFAGDRDISRVEVSTDGGQTWQQAQVKEALSPYTWVLWIYDWSPPGRGMHTIKVRAADGMGRLQSRQEAPPLPNGADGYHTIVVRLVGE